MQAPLKDYRQFLAGVATRSFRGGRAFTTWMILLSILTLIGLNAYARQFVNGLQTTGMTNQVSWGAYIANFTYLVGIAAAAVMLVIPAYLYKKKSCPRSRYSG